MREPRLSIVLNPDNKGFSAANNQGAAIARGRYLCFLNNDTVVHGAWLRTLVGHLRRHAQLGLVGPVTNAIGNEAKIGVGYHDLAGMPAWVDGHCEVNRGRLTDVSMLAFFCVAMPRWVWHRVGPLDERFGTGMFEDDDYNRRVREAGFEVGLARDSFVHHWQMASFNLLGNDEYMRIYRENQARYATKWTGEYIASDLLAALRRRTGEACGTVVFAPSVGWAIPLAQRPHHIARALAADGYVVVFDCSNASDEVDIVREVERDVFLYKGDPRRDRRPSAPHVVDVQLQLRLPRCVPRRYDRRLRLDRRPVGVSVRTDEARSVACARAAGSGCRCFRRPRAA